MLCPKCDAENPVTNSFCRSCGSQLSRCCPKCDFETTLGDKFCGKCGHSLEETAVQKKKTTSEAESERKHVTVLFSDLSGYTAMTIKLDPEEVKEIMSRIFGEIAQVIAKYEGFIERFIGDAVMAVFGVPKAHEDDPIRAIRAAKEIHDLVENLNPQFENRIDQPLSMHSGINTGLVVTGEIDVQKGTHGITGEAINLASRLQDLAQAGEILVGPDTFRQAEGHFTFKSLKPTVVKGRIQSLTPYRVVEESAIRTRFEAAQRRGLTTFTGRAQEIAALCTCLDKALKGNGQFVTVVGEAGVGKSRLIYEFRHGLDRGKITVLQGRCLSYGRNVPYFPLLNALRHGLHLHEKDSPSELQEKAVKNVLAIDETLEQYLPLYLHLLSIPSEDYPLPRHLHGQELINAIQKALAAINILNSKRQPIVLILEDWHWVDEASDSALKHLLGMMAPHHLMVVVIYRPEYASNWGNWSHHTPIVLKPMDSQHTEKIIGSAWKADRLPEGLSSMIHERTSGNPFFIEEVCNALIEEGIVQMREGDVNLTRAPEYLVLPDTVQAVIRARLDRLDHYARDSLRLASVIGREFSRRILERVSVFRERLSRSLETLKVVELIQQIHVIPETEYMFKHVLTQEVTYETILRQKRKELHELVGQAIEELYQDRLEEQVNLLQHHFSLAENWPKAVDYARQAANKAYKLSQFNEAVRLLEQAQEWLLKLPENRLRQKTQVDLQLMMNWSLQNIGDLDRALQNCQVAESVARCLESPVPLGKVYYQYGLSRFFKNQYKQAEQYLLQSLEHLRGSGEDALVLFVKWLLAVTYFSLAQWKKAAEFYSENIIIQEKDNSETDYLEEQPFLPYMHSCTHLGLIRALQGRVTEAKALIKKGHDPALEQAATLQSRVWCALWHSTFSVLVGEDHGASARIEQVYIISEETDSPILYFLGYNAKGNALMVAEQFDAARRVYEKALQAMEGTTYIRFLETVYYNLVLVNLILKDQREAERYYNAGLKLVHLNPEREAPRFDFLKGRLLASSSPPNIVKSETSFIKSIRADEASGVVVLAAQTRFYLSDLLAQKGELKRSRDMLTEIRDKFEKWEIPVWQKKCEQALKA